VTFDPSLPGHWALIPAVVIALALGVGLRHRPPVTRVVVAAVALPIAWVVVLVLTFPIWFRMGP
jgi:hypothetical protein